MAKTTDSDIMEVVETEELELKSEKSQSSEFDFNSTKFKALAIAGILLVGFIALQLVLGFSVGDYQVAIAKAEVDEDKNELKFQILIGTPMFGGAPSDPITLSISYGDEVVWTRSKTTTSTTMWVEVPFSEFYSGNSRATGASGADKIYSLDAELNGMVATTLELNSEMMDRTITSGDGELIVKTAQCDANTDCNGDNDKPCENPNDEDCGDVENNGLNHLGAQMRIALGVQDPVNEDLLLGISSDYSLQAIILYEGDEQFSYPQINVDGVGATWSDSGGYLSSFASFEGQWLTLGGTESILEESYIPRSMFYENGDGCYKIQLTVTHVSPFGTDAAVPLVFISDGYHFHWEYNENRDAANEPYKHTESC